MHGLTEILKDLDLSESETDVYLAMVEGAQSAREIIKLTRRKRPTVYYALNALWQKGLVSKSGSGAEQGFKLEPFDCLKNIVDERIRAAKVLATKIDDLVPSIEARTAAEKPQMSFFEGIEAVKTRIMYTLYTRNKFIYSIVPKTNFFWQVGEDFVLDYVAERSRRAIAMKSLWENTVNKATLQRYYQDTSQIKLLPKEMHHAFTTTIFLYDNKTLYIASKKNSYCVLIQSDEHAAMMKAVFEGLWPRGRKIL